MSSWPRWLVDVARMREALALALSRDHWSLSGRRATMEGVIPAFQTLDRESAEALRLDPT